jgi:hypothetical protein
MHYIIEKAENDSRSRKVVIDKTNHFSNEKKDYIIKLFDVKVEVIPYKESKKKYIKNIQYHYLEILRKLKLMNYD